MTPALRPGEWLCCDCGGKRAERPADEGRCSNCLSMVRQCQGCTLIQGKLPRRVTCCARCE